jgi:ABC-type sugar transport system ATPase subunit
MLGVQTKEAPPSRTHAIEAHGLTKRFGDTLALDNVDLQVGRGTVLGVLGPNGAGKTTAVRILATLLRADAGSALVGGLDVRKDAHRVRQSIGLTGQYASVDEDLTGTQNLVLIGSLLNLSSREARHRAAELLEWFDLTEAAGRMAKTYSGGMRRRLDLAAGLVSSRKMTVRRPDLDRRPLGDEPADDLRHVLALRTRSARLDCDKKAAAQPDGQAVRAALTASASDLAGRTSGPLLRGATGGTPRRCRRRRPRTATRRRRLY